MPRHKKKASRINFRFTPEQDAMIRQDSNHLGMDMVDFVAEAVTAYHRQLVAKNKVPSYLKIESIKKDQP